MTTYGKILVLLNFGLSVAAMTLAIVFYYTRIDWTEGSAAKPGELRARKARVDELSKSALPPAGATWAERRADVLDQEGWRVADRKWYDEQIRLALTDADGVAKPVRDVVYEKGRLVVDPVFDPKTNQPISPKYTRPRLQDAKDHLNNPLASLQKQTDKENNQLKALTKAQQDLQDQINEVTKWTDLLTPPPASGMKGVRQRIKDEKLKAERVDEELAIITPLLYTTGAENELILQRGEELKKRIDELSRALGVASGSKPR
jgi:hypothetical protein